MFKFLKSKKGFTLVELMIVVVIMAILVAVAVPIYSAVTSNAKKKTCAGNCREITGQLNSYFMGKSIANTGTLKVSFDASADDADPAVEANDANPFIPAADFEKLFSELPYCPAGGNITVAVADAGLGEVDSYKFTATCDFEGHADAVDDGE